MDHDDSGHQPERHRRGHDQAIDEAWDSGLRSGTTASYRIASTRDGRTYLRRISASEAARGPTDDMPLERWQEPHTAEERCAAVHAILCELLAELGPEATRVEWGPVDPHDPFHTALAILCHGPLEVEGIFTLDRDQLYTYLAATTGTFVRHGPDEALRSMDTLAPQILALLSDPLPAPPDWRPPFDPPNPDRGDA